MVAVIMKNADPKQFFKLYGNPDINILLDKLYGAGVKMMATPTAIKFAKNGEVLGSIPVQSSHVQVAIEKGLWTMGVNTPDALAIVHTMTSVLDLANNPEAVVKTKVDLPPPFIDPDKAKIELGAGGHAKINPHLFNPTKVQGPGLSHTFSSQTYPADQLLNGEKVKLIDATMLYQPVHGTSASSRYFCVGATEGLKIAARYNGGGLAVRVEGKSFHQWIDQLKDIGFTNVDKNKGYASIHLDCGDDVIKARKALGALLGALGVQLVTPVPQLDLIHNKGA